MEARLAKSRLNSPGKAFQISQFTLPDNNDFPAHLPQSLPMLSISLDVSREFVFPEFRIGFGRCGDFASFVSMPEATMYEHDRAIFGKNHVRLARKVFTVEPVAKAH